MSDYRVYYHLEDYLFKTVGPRFHDQGYLEAFDFFCIVIWKANRAKSRVAARLLKISKLEDLNKAAQLLTKEMHAQSTSENRLQLLMEHWGFQLPMASAILTVLYPDEFTIYDVRACGQLGKFQKLASHNYSEELWSNYREYIQAIRKHACDAGYAKLDLRDCDRFIWGQSFFQQLEADVLRKFGSSAAKHNGDIL